MTVEKDPKKIYKERYEAAKSSSEYSFFPDIIYKTEREKYKAVVDEIKGLYKNGQPVLVGTITIEKSEMLSRMLKRSGVPHSVLNAKHHQKEAEIVAKAGQAKTVTISTNMAGRGTDIVLGEGVRDLGGLHILGTERHESRRIDNQLRGRSGRQGDPGSSRFYLSLEDDLMRIFGSESFNQFYISLELLRLILRANGTLPQHKLNFM